MFLRLSGNIKCLFWVIDIRFSIQMSITSYTDIPYEMPPFEKDSGHDKAWNLQANFLRNITWLIFFTPVVWWNKFKGSNKFTQQELWDFLGCRVDSWWSIHVMKSYVIFETKLYKLSGSAETTVITFHWVIMIIYVWAPVRWRSELTNGRRN